MPKAVLCPGCGKTIPADAPQGLCPACLLQAGLGKSEATGPSTLPPPEPAERGGGGPTAQEAETLPPRLAAPAPAETIASTAGRQAAEPTTRADDPAFPSMPGYEILGELGRGGMGVVYRARQIQLQRVVALKMILGGAHAGTAELARFRTEAEAIARLQHPNIVQIHEVGAHQGLPFFSLEYCSGGSLAAKLNGTPRPPREAAALLEKLARAMHTAHEKGVIHRDLKPANVLLAEDGAPKITDFGLAKKLEEVGQTATGAVMGTPSYMAPEQAGLASPGGKSGEVGPAADIYALGAILYELLTGRPPFRAATPLDTILQVVSDEPVPPTQLQSKTPRDLETICLKCLRKEPAKRYGTALDLAEDVRRFLAGEPISARPVGRVERCWRWCRRHPAVAGLSAALVLLALIGFSVILRLWLEADANYVRAENTSSSLMESQGKLTMALKKAEVSAQEAKDESRRAGKERDEAEAARKEMAIAQAKTEAARQESRRRLSFLQLASAQRELQARSAQAQAFLEACPWDLHRWEWFFLSEALARGEGKQNIYHVPDLLAPEQKAPPGPRDLVTHRLPGRWLGFIDGGRSVVTCDRKNVIHVVDLVSGKSVGTLPSPEKTVGMAVLPDGQRLVGLRNHDELILWDRSGKTLHTLGKKMNAFGLALACQAGQIAAVYNGAGRVWDSATGREIFSFNTGEGGTQNVAFSADGRLLGATRNNRVKGLPPGLAVDVYDARNGKLLHSLVAQRNAWVRCFAFSPDSRYVAMGREHPSSLELWDLEAGQLVRTMYGHGGHLVHVAFTPDGKSLGSVGSDENLKLWDVESGLEILSLRGVTSYSPLGIGFSQDGQGLAITRSDSEVTQIFAAPRQEHPAVASPAAPQVAFSPDGALIACAAYDEGQFPSPHMALRVLDAATGEELKLLPLPRTMGFASRRLVFTPDGKGVLLNASDAKTARLIEWDWAASKEIRAYPFAARDMAYRPDGKLLAVAHVSGGIHVLEAASGKKAFSLPGKMFPVAMAWSAQGKFLAVADSPDLHIVDGDSGKPVRTIHSGADPPMGFKSLAFSPVGNLLAFSIGDGGAHIRILDLDTGKEIQKLVGHERWMHSLAFSRDGKRLVSASADRSVKLWDVATGRELRDLTTKRGTHYQMVVSPDRRRLAIADGTVRVWEFERFVGVRAGTWEISGQP